MSNMFDMGMFGMLHPDERKRILEGGSLTTAGGIKTEKKEPWYKKFQDKPGMTTAGGAGDISGEAADPTTVGQKTSSMIQPVYNKKTGKVENRALNPAYDNKNLVPPKWDKNKQEYIAQDASKTPAINKVYQDSITQGGKGANMPQDLNWWQKLSGMFNSKFDLEGAKADWTKKGGFEGLMSNPAFTMGLAFMQSAAEGKSLGSGALDNVMKAGGISQHYKQIIEDRKLEPIQATGGDIAEVKDMLKSINIEKGNWFENFLGGQQSGAKWEAAVEEIAIEFQKEIREKQTALKEAGKSQVIKRTDQLKILERLVSSGKIKKKGSILSYLGITAHTLQDTSGTKGFDNKAQGGPVARGQTYVVGEGGPEYFLPQESGKILSNDDSRIFAMLLSANPQLQNVSKTRSEKILRNRFPEYFE